MKTFVIAYFSAHEGALEQRIVLADSELSAMNTFLQSDFPTLEELEDVIVNSDSWINIIGINNTLTE